MAINWRKPIRTISCYTAVTDTDRLYSFALKSTIHQAKINGQWYSYYPDGTPASHVAPRIENYEEETKVTALDVTKPVEYVIDTKADGIKEARILDANLKNATHPIAFVFTDKNGEECVRTCDRYGITAAGYHLRNKKTKITGWINVYAFGNYTGPFDSQGEALRVKSQRDYLTTVQIEYEV